MNNLSKEEQLIAVKKVLEEMKYAEEFLRSWNLGWWEQLSNAYSLDIYENADRSEILNIEKKYQPRYRLTDACFNDKGIGIPLCSVVLTGNNSSSCEKNADYVIDFGDINWFNIISKISERKLNFSNNGDIRFFKDAKNNYSRKHPRRVSYNTQFNVLEEWFKINITISNLLPINDIVYNCNHISLLADKTCILMKCNNVQIIYDLIAGAKTIKTEQTKTKNNKVATISYELRLNNNEMIEIGNVVIKIKSCSGYVIGTYQFDVSSSKGIRANFYSKKGKTYNLVENQDMVNTAKELLPSLQENRDASTILINDFIASIEKSINNQTIGNISSINDNLNIDNINIIERQIIDELKNIKGELPLKGLIQRIDFYLEILEKLNPNLVSNNSKKRELNLNKKLI